jgi:hypothetical protein
MRRIFQRSQKSTTATQNGSDSSSAIVNRFISPATVLAFLIAILLSIFVIKGSQSLQSQSADYQTETAVDSQTGATEQSTVEIDVTGSESTQGLSRSSSETTISTDSSIDNGVGSVTVEVNGQEVPVDQNSVTHQVIQNDSSRTTIDVNLQNNQSSSSSSGDSDSNSSIKIRSQSRIDIDN